LSEDSTKTRDLILLSLIATCASVAALAYYYRHDAVLLYGDAVAHINIARRVFDSRRPGPGQLGTVWLPLPHVLMLPFIISKWAWQTGIGGAIPSMVGYVAGVVGIFRLLWRGLQGIGASRGRARLAAWLGAVAFGANPNLLYLQATPMGESLYLAFFIWAVVFLAEFVYSLQGAGEAEDLAHITGAGLRRRFTGIFQISSGGLALRWCGVMLLCGMLTRYDGWFVSAWFGGAVLLAMVVHGVRSRARSEVGRNFAIFVFLLAIGPAFWLAWNKTYFGNALEWMNGPYSARAIMQRGFAKGYPPHPGYHDVKTAAVYYVKCAKLNLAGNNLGGGGARYGWPRRIEMTWPVLALAGTGLMLAFAPSLWPLLLLWVPLLFYTIAIAYGGVPIFMPVWWPFSFYNVRYGLQMLPAAAVFAAMAVYFLKALAQNRIATTAVAIAAFAFLGVSYGSIWKSGPVCLHEAQENSGVRIGLERRLGDRLRALPENSTLMMQVGYYVGALERAGIPLKRTINETDFKLWKSTLADPAAHADYLVAAQGDRVAAVARDHSEQFAVIETLTAPGEPTVTIYKKR